MAEEEEWVLIEDKTPKSEKHEKKKPKKSIAVIIAAALPLLLIVYVLYMNIASIGHTKTYTLQLGELNDNNSHNDIYIQSWQGSPQIRYGNEEYRILNGVARIVFKPQVNLDKAETFVNIDFEGNETLYIKNNDAWEVYWKPAWNKYAPLYSFNVNDEDIAYLHNPANLKKGDSVRVMMNPAYNNINHADKPATLREWLAESKNESLYFHNVGFENYKNDELEYNPGPAFINTTLRGTHKFYVYLNDTLNLTVWKKDLNSYDGRDDMNITLYDFDGNIVYHEMFYDDDDWNISVLDAKNKSMPIQNDTAQMRNFYASGLMKNVYLLSLTTIKGQNRYEDISISKLIINTDKIVITDYIYPLNQVKLYTETGDERQLGISYSSSGSNQNLTIEGDEPQIISLMKNESGKTKSFKIKGSNWLISPKGNMILKGNVQFAFNKENYFSIYKYELNDENSDYVILKSGEYPIMSQNISIKSDSNRINSVIVNVKRWNK
jgi:hypothetical protein